MMRNKLEQNFAEQFDAVAESLPGGPAVSEARRAAISAFGEMGLPHRRIEEWKYTDLRNAVKEALPVAVADKTLVTTGDLFVALGPLAKLEAPRIVFVNGSHRRELSNLEAVSGVEVKPLGEALSAAQDKVGAGLARLDAPSGDAVLALNTAYMTDGAIVRIARNAVIEKPLLIVYVRAGSEPRFVATRNIISVGEGARATIVEAYLTFPGAVTTGQHNTASEMIVGDKASVTHVKCVADRGAITHLSNWIAVLGSGCTYRPFQFTAGAALARNQILVTYKGEGTRLDLSGAFFGRGGDHIDTTLTVDHAVPHCESRELFKGVLDGHARGIFQGKIIVRPDAQKTDGKQMAQALMLSPDAEFDSKPELEIYADDVVCGHGSTVAEIDHDLLFYCRSRGIPPAEARRLLIDSFIGEALDKVEHEGVRDALTEFARGWLEG